MKILLVDDDILICSAISKFLEYQMSHEVTQCNNGFEALELFKKNPFPLVLADIRMPGMTGIELLENLKMLPEAKTTDVVLITGHGDLTSAIQALRLGAYDYLQKPIEVEEMAAVIARIEEHQSLLLENFEYKHQFEEKLNEATQETLSKLETLQNAYAEVVGIGKIGIFSDTMRSIVDMAEKFHHDRTIPVLIEGETGTGKEIIARLVHHGHGEETTPFISLNCSAIAPGLFESELFGYEGGAFSGSKQMV